MAYEDLHTVYRATALVTVIGAGLSLAAFLLPYWVYSHTEIGPSLSVDHYFGLSKQCGSTASKCSAFPSKHDCKLCGEGFCAAWKSASFFMSLSLMLQLCGLVSYAFTFLSKRHTFLRAWKIISVFQACSVATQSVTLTAIALALETSSRFQPIAGHVRLALCWILKSVVCVCALISLVSLVIVGKMSPPELDQDDYADELSQYSDDDGLVHDDFYYFTHQE